MRNILFLITKSEVGGAQKWVKEQMHICSKSFNCFVSTNKKGWLTEHCDTDQIFVDQGIESRFSPRYLYNLVQLIMVHKIDLIVASSANAGLYARMAKLLLRNRIKVIYVSHGWSALYNSTRLKTLYVTIERGLSFLSDAIICVSESDLHKAISEIGIAKNKLTFIPNSILPMNDIRGGRCDEVVKVLSVGRFDKPKRFDLLVRAVENLDVDLHLVGSGSQLEEIRQIAPDNVKFHGNVYDFNNYADFDIFCLISDSEGLPLAAIEAMSCGLPLVLSDVGGCAELIEGNGFLTLNNVDDIISKIKLAKKSHIELGNYSLRIFKERFCLLSNQDLYIDLYDRCITSDKL
jgi:glycosyltransferase involved in cell wall biosynthesis